MGEAANSRNCTLESGTNEVRTWAPPQKSGSYWCVHVGKVRMHGKFSETDSETDQILACDGAIAIGTQARQTVRSR